MRNQALKKLGLLGLISLFFFLCVPCRLDAQPEEIQTRLRTQAPQYVPGEVLVKFKEGVVPQEVLKQLNLEVEAIERIHSIAPAVANFKKDYKLEKDTDGWYWFLGKKYKETTQIPDEKLFQGTYQKMSLTERGLYRSYKINLPEGLSVEEAVLQLRNNPNVEYAQPNYIHTLCTAPSLPPERYIPNDYYLKDGLNWRQGSWGQAYPDLWGLRNTKTIEAWNLFDTNQNGAIDAGEKLPGAGTVVAVIDTGVDYNYEDLASNIWLNPDEIPDNGIDDDRNGYIDDIRGYDISDNDNDPSDYQGHGTHVAGTIVAVANNGIGIAGVAPGAKIMPVKFFPNASSDNAAKCIKYAADSGADVLSNSWGGSSSSDPTIEEAIKYAYDEHNCLVVFAASNDNDDVARYSPANYEKSLAVASIDNNDIKSDFSNYGSLIAVSAPGGGSAVDDGPDGPYTYRNILSLRAQGTDMYGEVDPQAGICIVGEKYYRSRGTSMACPHVAGLAAVIKSMYPEISNDEIYSRIVLGADNIDFLNPDYAGLLGRGRFNTYNSLTIGPRPFLKLVDVETDNLQPGREGTMVISLKNFWQSLIGVEVTLSTDNEYVIIRGATKTFGDILTSQIKSNSDNPFIVSIDELCPYGTTIEFDITVTAASGYNQTFKHNIELPYFRDVGEKTGLLLADFYPRILHLEDYNHDGYTDAYFGGFSPQILYRNNQDGTFTSANLEAGLNLGDGVLIWAPVFLDIDNDGDKDLFVGRRGDSDSLEEEMNLLYLNNGDGTFTDISQTSGLNNQGAHSVLPFDFDNDGYVDLFTLRPIKLLRNNGDNTFTDVTAQSRLLGESYDREIDIVNMVSLDYNNDGYQDILLGGVFRPWLFRNNGAGVFTDVTVEVGIDISRGSRQASANVAVGDYNNDGHIDIFYTGFDYIEGDERPLSILYKNNGNGTFTDTSAEAGKPGEWRTPWTGGTDFFDYDNDGDLDIHITGVGGHQIGEEWIADEINAIYRNNGDQTFSEVTEVAFPEGISPTFSTAAMGDYDNDGDLDIYAPAGFSMGAGAFLENMVGNDNNWVKINLEDTVGNHLGYGARVYVTTGDKTQLREVHEAAVETVPLHFGLGQATVIDEIKVLWPNGRTQLLTNVGINQIITITANAVNIFGDISGDNEITAFDAALAAHIAVDLEHPDIKNRAAAEVSGDGEVTAYDAALIAQKAVGLIEKFPVE